MPFFPKLFLSQCYWYLPSFASISDSIIATLDISSFLSKPFYECTNFIHGFSVFLSHYEFEFLKYYSGCGYTTKDKLVKINITHTSRLHGLNGHHVAWPQSRYGKDVIIGFVHTKVWLVRKSFNDDGMPEVLSR